MWWGSEVRILVLSDPHFAGTGERARRGWERRAITSPGLRWVVGAYRRWIWLADPTAHNDRLHAFLGESGEADWVVANGDYSCDSAFIGVADDAAFDSAQICLGHLREAFGPRLRCVLGDHELGKFSMFGGRGGLRLASWRRAVDGLGIEPWWQVEAGEWSLMGVTSSLLALPTLLPEALESERGDWMALRESHLEDIRRGLEALGDRRRWVLFCHDPTALPYLAEEPVVRRRLPQLAATVIGHLHSEGVFRLSRVLSGMPHLHFLGHTVRRLSGALRRARQWGPFRVRLCPSTAGIQLLKDGGYLEIDLDPGDPGGMKIQRKRLPWGRDRSGTEWGKKG